MPLSPKKPSLQDRDSSQICNYNYSGVQASGSGVSVVGNFNTINSSVGKCNFFF